jgi:hypothetical protein
MPTTRSPFPVPSSRGLFTAEDAEGAACLRPMVILSGALWNEARSRRTSVSSDWLPTTLPPPLFQGGIEGRSVAWASSPCAPERTEVRAPAL